MPQIVAAFGSSHSAMLHAERENWLALFDHVDCQVPIFDAAGNPARFEALRTAAGPRVRELLAPDIVAGRFDETQAAMDRLHRDIAAARLDALIVVGDDQRELFKDAARPAVAIYYGETIRNAAAPDDHAADWFVRARNRRMEPGKDAHYPCHARLGRHLIEGLCARGFDITAIKDLAGGQFEGHAFSFLHRRYLQESTTRMVPVFLNTYYPPNQPTPARCFALGAAIREAVASFPEDIRVGIMASGGLSHYRVDEALDRTVIDALRRRDDAFLASLPPQRLISGTSEIRNWICAAAAARDLELAWLTYVAGYRSSALTGVGLCFAHWS